ncbi:MAG TPA: T9SS C-terminal target domain-containing protein [Bacteroidia bacterium]|nr:T9SS C-terminal target domain-containing protein [Bacteroidia bacterium]
MEKIILLIVLFVLCCVVSFSQEIRWQNTIGGNNNDIITSIEQTADGGYILGGYSESGISGDKTEGCVGSPDYWIVKTDASGNIQWQNTIGGYSTDYLFSTRQTADGGYILGGYSGSPISGDKTELCIGGYDYWIVKTDSMGNIQWQNTIGGSSYDELYSIQQTSDMGYILGGHSTSNSGGDKTENNNGVVDFWIVKTDSLGNIQWDNTIGGSSDDQLHSIQGTVDGGYILGGSSYSDISGDKTENSNGSRDYWIVKTDSLGNIQWQNTIGGNNYDKLYSIQQTADGGYILAGYSNSIISGDKTENSIGNDYWIVKTDSLGIIQWQNTIGGSGWDEPHSIQQTGDGGYILCGYSGSNISGDKTENCTGTWDFWIVKTDALGNIIWQNTIGGNNDDRSYSIRQTADGGYIVGGFSDSNISGDKTENSMGSLDYWIVKLTDNYNLITGKLFFDANSNAMQDAGEPAVANKTVT